MALQERYGETVGKDRAAEYFFRHLLFTDSYLESYDAVLTLDDDDGNPATPSPNHCLINQVFTNRGLVAEENCDDRTPLVYPSDTTDSSSLRCRARCSRWICTSSIRDEKFFICMDRREVCLSERRVHLELPLLTRNDERYFYEFQGVFTLDGVDWVTLITKDEEDQMTGSRAIKIFTK